MPHLLERQDWSATRHVHGRCNATTSIFELGYSTVAVIDDYVPIINNIMNNDMRGEEGMHYSSSFQSSRKLLTRMKNCLFSSPALTSDCTEFDFFIMSRLDGRFGLLSHDVMSGEEDDFLSFPYDVFLLPFD